MRRLSIVLALAALCLPVSAQAATRVSAFYYPWYATTSHDGGYQHWSQHGHAPPNDIASAFYPARGLYSSADRVVIGEQMDELHVAGVDEIGYSWWGRGSSEDARLPAVLAAARAQGISVAAHLEPYTGRSVAGTIADVRYLRGLGIRTFYVYRALELPSTEWLAANATLHAEGITTIAQTALVGAAAAAGFDGVYTYDVVVYGGDKFMRLCRQAHKMHLICAPSVGPGYDARRGSGDPKLKLRRNGATYDTMWRAAIAAGADRVTITSYNEWHEGTQIEPAALPGRRGRYRYLSYDGAWGLHGLAAEYAYLVRTRYWADVLRSTSPAHPSTRAS
jgi:glycoprotein endo-alpha-1,2-mannosidase